MDEQAIERANDEPVRERADNGEGLPVIGRFRSQLREFATTLLKEDLTPGRAAAAVFAGIFIGIVPIYGFQLITAVGVALLFKLNKPLTVAGTFINNALLRPIIIVSSVEIGYLLRSGSFRPFHLSALSGAHVKEEILAFVIGSVVLGAMVGGVGAAITAVVVQARVSADRGLRERVRFVNGMFSQCSRGDRGFVRWKLRLDRIFELLGGVLAGEGMGSGTIVDLGCGHGIALGFAAFADSRRRLVGCDLDGRRITVARRALSDLNAEVSVADIRSFELPPADLILILDVLQYLPADEQLDVLRRCCSALATEGKLIVRVHDRERGLRSAITMAFDRLIFACGRSGVRPLTLSVSEYRSGLEKAGMQVEERRFQNRLPLAHILFIARKPLVEVAA